MSSTARTSISGLPTRCGSATEGFASSSCTCSGVTGTPSISCALRMKSACRPCSVSRRSGICSAVSAPFIMMPSSARSIPVDCGFQEAQCLEVSEIDSQRLMIHVPRGKGAQDRCVPLPHATLQIVRTHWRHHTHPRLLFPALSRNGHSARTAQTPMAKSSVQGAFRAATEAAGICTRQVSVHTLRHSYATHLLEAGVTLRVIQRYRGHATLETTMISLHLTHTGQEDASQLIDRVMEGLSEGDHHRDLPHGRPRVSAALWGAHAPSTPEGPRRSPPVPDREPRLCRVPV